LINDWYQTPDVDDVTSLKPGKCVNTRVDGGVRMVYTPDSKYFQSRGLEVRHDGVDITVRG